MAYEVIMPKNGMAMEEGKLLRWLKNVGDRVEKDEALIEIETDKITMEEPAAASGVLLAQWAAEGDTVPVLQVIGWIGEAGEAVPAKPAASATEEALPQSGASVPEVPKKLTDSGIASTPYAKTLASELGIDIADVPPTGRRGEVTGDDVKKATPLAKRVAADLGVDLSGVEGSGHAGKVRAEDVWAKTAAPAVIAGAGAVRKPISGMRRAVMRGMFAAHSQIPPVTQNLRADVTELFALRKKLNEGREKKFSLNDLIAKATVKALLRHPEILVSLDGEEIICHNRVHLGVAVSLSEGLIVPVVREADKMGLEALSEAIGDLASRARSGGLSPDEYAGSTFTITNLGMYGIESFTPIINQPNAAILGVCAAVDELCMIGGEVQNRKKMTLSVTFDHRVLDGVPPAKFQLTLKGLLENPLEILL